MCRIWGVSYGHQREILDNGEIAEILYPALVHQGPHSWGWMSYSEETEGITLDKYPGRCDTDAAHDIQMEEIDPYAKWIVGHVRYATHGSPKDNRNNHPMSHGNIIGVHNGVLRNHDKILAITGREDPKTQVDSEAIFAAINRWGPKNGLAKIDGDMVTIYANYNRPHVLHIGRSHGRQLTIGWTTRGNLIFASEEQALHKLEPLISFRKFSTISENRLLIVRNGKIIQRLRFAPPRPRYVAPAPSQKASTALPTGPTFWERQRAQRRGEILFPRRDPIVSSGKAKGRGGEPDPIRWEIDEIVDADGTLPVRRTPNQNQKLYYYEGELLTFAEYQEVIESNS